MSMYTINGELRNAFIEKFVDKETGEEITKHRIQVEGHIPTRDGGSTKLEMVTLTVERKQDYEAFLGQEISVPFGMFSPAKGTVIQFVPKGYRPAA